LRFVAFCDAVSLDEICVMPLEMKMKVLTKFKKNLK